MVSVIVPVYNVEKYLRKCIDSIINQTLKDIEIILIDDGSSDNSGIICDQYAQKDNRIKVVHQENQGVSVARNNGIEISSGEYIIFVDSDDYIEQEMFEVMYQKACEENIDCVVCNFKRILNNEIFINDYKMPLNEILDNICIKNYVKNFYNLLFWGATWCKLIRRSIIIENNIKFLPKVDISEDSVFMLEVFLNLYNMYIIDKSFYNYVCRDNSLTTKKYRKNLMYSYNQVYIKVIELYKKFKIKYDKYALIDLCKKRLLYVLRQEKYNNLSIKEGVKLFKNIRNTKMIKDVFKYVPVLSFPMYRYFLVEDCFINKLKNLKMKFIIRERYYNLFLLKYRQYYLLAKRINKEYEKIK